MSPKPLSKAKAEANKKYDSKNFKYQSVKLKLAEWERLQKAVEVSGDNVNGFMRRAINELVAKYIGESESERKGE